MKRLHHEFSPSRLDRTAGCPWSYRNCIGWESGENEDSGRGTLLHRAVYDDSAYDSLGENDRGMIDFIRDEHIRPYSGMKMYHELFVQVYDSDTLLTEGVADCLTISPDGTKASLKDWKFGNYEVAPAAENMQIKAYVCGIFQKFPKITTVYAMIVQPVYGSADYDNQCEFRREQLSEMIAEIASVIDRAKSAAEADANPTAENCRYCNKLHCRAFCGKMEQNFEIMNLQKEELSIEEENMTLEFADRLICAEKEIKDAMKHRTDIAKKLIIAAGGSAKFRVQAGRITRKTDWKKLARDKQISDDEIAAYTTETTGEPYLMPRMRRPKQLKG